MGKSIYVIHDAGRVGKEGESLYFQNFKGEKKLIHPELIDRLVVIGKVEISNAALKIIMERRIETAFLNKNGRFNAKLQFELGKNVDLRGLQYRLLEDSQRRLRAVRGILKGKVQNQIVFLQRVQRREHRDVFENSLNSLRNLAKKIETAQNLEEFRGLEGMASRHYYDVFRYHIHPEWAEFHGRSKHPPRDNVNAVLSLLYTYLYYRMDALIEINGLDSGVGALHELEYGRRSLAFDLIEEFRVPVCDTLCCALFNLGILEAEDFQHEPDKFYPEEESEVDTVKDPRPATYLTKEGLLKVSQRFEERMNEEVIYPRTERRMSYFEIMNAQVEHYKDFLLGRAEEYLPFQIR